MKFAVVAALLAALPAAAMAQASSDLERGVQLRREGHADQAVLTLQAATRAHPEDADAWLNLGLAYADTNHLTEAEAALDRAQILSPNYLDVQIARARVAYFRQDPAEAQRRLATVLAAQPDNAEAQALSRQLAAARAAGVAPWRVDLTYTHGRLGKGLPDSQETTAAVTRRFGNGLVVGGALDRVRQFGRSDTYQELTLANRRAYVAVGGTSNAHFRPQWAVRGGVYGDPLTWGGWTVQPLVDAGWSRYPLGDVRSVTPGLDVAHGQTLLVGLRWINVVDEADKYLGGYSLRGQWRPAGSPIALEGGWSDAPESNEGATVRVKTSSVGLAWDLTPDFTLRLTGNHQARRAYDRDDVTFGVTRRF